MTLSGFAKMVLAKRAGKGTSKSAEQRRQSRDRLHAGNPGDVLKMADGTVYAVAKDGSFRRGAKVA